MVWRRAGRLSCRSGGPEPFASRAKLTDVIGPILMVVALVVVLPLTTLLLAALASMAFGGSLNRNSAETHADHELTPLNR